MGCGKSMPVPNPNLIGLWISETTKESDIPNLRHNFEIECRHPRYKAAKIKINALHRPCHGAMMEIDPSGYVRFIIMDGKCARKVYSGPITDWGDDGVWSGFCPTCCCRKGCMHFDTTVVQTDTKDTFIIVDGVKFVKAVFAQTIIIEQTTTEWKE